MAPDEPVSVLSATNWSFSATTMPVMRPTMRSTWISETADITKKPLVNMLRFFSTFVSASRPLYSSPIVSLPSPDVSCLRRSE